MRLFHPSERPMTAWHGPLDCLVHPTAHFELSYIPDCCTPFSILGRTVSYLVLGGSRIDEIIMTLRFQETPSPEDYMNSLVDIVEASSYYSTEIDWQFLRSEVIARADPEDYTRAIDYLIDQLRRVGDRHSFYFVNPSTSTDNSEPTLPIVYQSPVSELETDSIGYIQIFSIADPEFADEYTAKVQQRIEELEQLGAMCWIVDFSANRGGNMYPMIMGLYPLLGDGPIGGFQYGDGTRQMLALQQGEFIDVVTDTVVYPELVQPSNALTIVDPPIAVLQSRQTASAAENTLLALHGRPNVRTFGKSTAGLTVGNTVYQLFDGNYLAVATAASMDRYGNVFEGPIPPDVDVYEGRAEAVTWLQDEMGCMP